MELKKFFCLTNVWNSIICVGIIIINFLLWLFIFLPPIQSFFPAWLVIILSLFALSLWCGFPFLLIIYTPVRIIYETNDSFVFYTFFRKKRICKFKDITICKSDFYHYDVHLVQVHKRKYLEAVRIVADNMKESDSKYTIIPYSCLFKSNKRKCSQRVDRLIYLLKNLKKESLKNGLIADLDNKRIEYMKNGKIKKKIMYVDFGSSSYEIIEK